VVLQKPVHVPTLTATARSYFKQNQHCLVWSELKQHRLNWYEMILRVRGVLKWLGLLCILRQAETQNPNRKHACIDMRRIEHRLPSHKHVKSTKQQQRSKCTRVNRRWMAPCNIAQVQTPGWAAGAVRP